MICVWWKRWGAVVGKKGDSHYPLHVVWGQTTGFNQLRRMCLSTWTCACVCQSENPPSAGMEMSLVMHLPATVVPDNLSHPCIARVCHLHTILHPSLSVHPTSILHPQPPSETRDKSQWKLLQGECSGRILLFCCLCRLSSLQHYLCRVPRCCCSDKQCCCWTVG